MMSSLWYAMKCDVLAVVLFGEQLTSGRAALAVPQSADHRHDRARQRRFEQPNFSSVNARYLG